MLQSFGKICKVTTSSPSIFYVKTLITASTNMARVEHTKHAIRSCEMSKKWSLSMYARILKFLTNLLFKQVFSGFFPGRKKRKPGGQASCYICYVIFPAFNKRQKVCCASHCVRVHRARQYRARIDFAKAERKGKMEAIQARERETAAIIIGPTLESEE